jgi:P27 family predicted phage terminase small subunit
MNKNEPKPELGATMPEGLSPKAAEHWPKIAAQLERVGVLTQMDAQALALYCEAFSNWRTATDALAKSGMVVRAPSGYPMPNPYLAIQHRASEQLRKLLIEFGMTPSSRSKVSATGDGAKPANPFTKFKRNNAA